MFCHRCGVKLIDEAQFCHACGTKVVGGVEPTEQKPIPETPIPQQKAPLVEPQKGTPFVVIGWVSFGLSLVFCLSPVILPLLFGLVALIMGIFVIKVRSESHGITLTILAVFGTLSSIAIGHAVRTVFEQYYYYF